jgi:hypothetical protein
VGLSEKIRFDFKLTTTTSSANRRETASGEIDSFRVSGQLLICKPRKMVQIEKEEPIYIPLQEFQKGVAISSPD